MAGAGNRPVEDQFGYDPGQCPRPRRSDEPVFPCRDDRHRSGRALKVLGRLHPMAEQPAHRKPGIMVTGDLDERIERRDEDKSVDPKARSEVGGHAASDAEADCDRSPLAKSLPNPVVDRDGILLERAGSGFRLLGA